MARLQAGSVAVPGSTHDTPSRSEICLGRPWSSASASPALAHPHVWVTARAEIVFAPRRQGDGRSPSLDLRRGLHGLCHARARHEPRRQALPGRAAGPRHENAASLNEFDYFTVLKARGKPQAFDRAARSPDEHGEDEGRHVLLPAAQGAGCALGGRRPSRSRTRPSSSISACRRARRPCRSPMRPRAA